MWKKSHREVMGWVGAKMHLGQLIFAFMALESNGGAGLPGYMD